ncbi:MAG TPA: DUF5305 family protein [Mobilitalea sp.]|nr:DUF5305 family protein [Mobilitalea sp.]
MKTKWYQHNLLLIVLLLVLIISCIWIYYDMKAGYRNVPETDVNMAITPQYQIISRQALNIWPAGTVFDQGMAAYFYAAKPEVKVTPVIALSGLIEGYVEGTVQSTVMLQAVNDKSEIYWSYLLNTTPEETFRLQNGNSNANGSTFTANEIILDPAADYDLASQIANEIMFQANLFQVAVTSNINLTGTIYGTPVHKSFTQELPISLQQVSFTMPGSQDIVTSITLNEKNNQTSFVNRITQNIRVSPLPFYLFIITLICVLILVWLKFKSASKTVVEHRRFKDWITEGSVEINNRTPIQIHALEGLVDIAIDLDKRVIFDSKINKYYVLTEDIVYLYDSKRINESYDKKQLGRLLLNHGLLQPEQLETGLYYQNKIGARLGESLIALGFIDETTLYSTLASQSNLDYYDIENLTQINKDDWLDKMNRNKAKALMAIPLGKRADGSLVIACSEFSKYGMQKELQDIFGSQIHMVATRPTIINRIFEQLALRERNNLSFHELRSTEQVAPWQRLSKEELEEFIASYYRGNIITSLLLKASGIVDETVLKQIPNKEPLLNWLINKSMINSEIANLIKGLDKAVKSMEWKERQEMKCPNLMELLLEANYLTSDTEEWINRELKIQGLPIEQLLINNFLASPDTINNAGFLLEILHGIINKEMISE